MGVIYRAGDDVADLLVPFIREQGGIEDAAAIEAAYRAASLGQLSAQEFWDHVGVSPALEDEYLARFELSEGVLDVLRQAPARFQSVVCLSNDVSEWSRKLRSRFRLELHFTNWYISGDLGLRKPNPRIYVHVLKDLRVSAAQVVFVDDRVKNLEPAAELGFATVHYHTDAGGPVSRHRTIRNLAALLE
jgi:putative hydrolase of the HAD superfamily